MTAPSTPALPIALVVEDDEHIGTLLKFMLERAGYRVALQCDGRAALAYVEGQPAPRVALFDYMLPFVDGVELVHAVRRQPGWEHVPVLMLTAKAQERDIARALEAGASDYLAKPFQPEALMARVRSLAAAGA
jgi:two-component system alkaline phosphatase synthesis response regulator PhoP